MIRVGGAQNRPLAPGNGKKDSLAFGHDDGFRNRNARAFNDNMNAFCEPEPYPTVRQTISPRTGGVHNGSRLHGNFLAGQLISELTIPELLPRGILKSA